MGKRLTIIEKQIEDAIEDALNEAHNAASRREKEALYFFSEYLGYETTSERAAIQGAVLAAFEAGVIE